MMTQIMYTLHNKKMIKSGKELSKSSKNEWLKKEKSYQNEIFSKRLFSSTQKGKIEYATLGEGPVVMCIHGMPGGFDQGILGFDWLATAGFRIIAPSRPGYLGTPLETGKTYPEAADAYASLLDKLNIDKVSVVSISGGGPSAYQFAIRHQDRINALAPIDSIVLRTSMPADFGKLANVLYFSAAGQKLFGVMAKYFPSKVLQELLKSNSFLTDEEIKEQVSTALNDQAQMSMMYRIISSMSNYSRRKIGVENDIRQFTQLGDLPLEKINCPTLIVHGTHDNLLFYQAVQAKDRIQNAESLWIEKGSHFNAWIHPEASKTQQQVTNFLMKHT